MFCCFPLSRRPRTLTQSDEEKPFVTSEPTKIQYRTIFTIPYAHVLRDDKIQIDSSNVTDTKTPAAYLLVNGSISDQDYEAAFFPFDHADISTPVVFATKTTTTSHILLEHIYQIEHVTAHNPSTTTRMDPLSSNTVPKARPFDEFSTDPPDVQSDNTITKLD